MSPWNIFKGGDSRPTTPKIGSVPLPEDVHLAEELFSPKRRARTPSILKRFTQTNASRASVCRPASPVSPLKPGKDSPPSPLTPESPVGCKPASRTPSSEGSQYFRVEPESRCSTPMVIPPSRVASPRASTPGVPTLRSPTPRAPTPGGHSVRSSTPRTPSYSSSAPRTSSHGPPRSVTPQTPSFRAHSPELKRHSKQSSINKDSPLVTPAPPPPSDLPNPELHWQLLPYDSARSKPYLRFDIAHPSDLITFPAYTRPARASELNKLATRSPLTEMTIRCSRLPQWEVQVRRSGEGAIRCVDVFAAIYETFHCVLTDEERQYVPEDYLKGCEKYFKSRCKAAACLTDVEELQGMRRVDLLRGRTMFKGLTCPAPGKGYWMLHLEQQR